MSGRGPVTVGWTSTVLSRAAGLVLALAVVVACPGALAAQFEAQYKPLADSPIHVETSWYSGAVTNAGTFVYGLGHSHNAHGDNSLWEYVPATNSHVQLQPSTGHKWRWQEDANKQVIKGTGHWDTLDPVADKALVDYFGGTTINALTNRNNHQAFYMPARNEFWVLAGTTFYQDAGNYFAGRFDLATHRWTNISANLAEFSAGLIAGRGWWVAPNAATAVCGDLNTVVLFGGMSGTGGVLMIEPNTAGPEPYRWASAPVPPIYQPAENVRHNAVCVGDTVYFLSGQERVPNVDALRTPDPAPFWAFHVPARTWTRLPDGPPGGYFLTLTYDSDAQALLRYGGGTGSGSAALWVYDLPGGQWHDLTGTVPGLPRVDMHTGGFIPGFGHVFKGGRQFTDAGADMGYTASRKMTRIVLKRVGGDAVTAQKPVATLPSMPEPPAEAAPNRGRTTTQGPAGVRPTPSVGVTPSQHAVPLGASTPPGAEPSARKTIAQRVREHAEAGRPAASPPQRPDRAIPVAQDQSPPATGGAIVWTKVALATRGVSPVGEMKHQRLVEGPGGRVYILGGDWGGDGGEESGRQEVFSFNPLVPTGDWRLEAPYCGTTENPVHWHTDEAGVAWDAKRGVIWKLAGTEYSTAISDPCFDSRRSIKAKVIAFDPATHLWTVPPHLSQTRFGWVTNGVLDPVKDELVQIIDHEAKHLSLETGQWTGYPLPGDVLRFNAIVARVGRDLYWTNRKQVLESYNLDTHKMTAYSVAPWPVPAEGWEMQIVMPLRDKVLVMRPTSQADHPRHAAIFDPATRQWTTLDPGAGWGNTGMMHSSGHIIMMGGGINGPEYQNKQVWVGVVQ